MFCYLVRFPSSLKGTGSFQDCFPAHHMGLPLFCGIAVGLECVSVPSEGWTWDSWGSCFGFIELGILVEIFGGGVCRWGGCQLGRNFGEQSCITGNLMAFFLCGMWYIYPLPGHLIKSLVKIRFSLFSLSQCEDCGFWDRLIWVHTLTSLPISFVAMKFCDTCKPHLLLDNSIYFIGWFWGFNEVVHVKHLAWLLAHNKCSIKLTCCNYC